MYKIQSTPKIVYQGTEILKVIHNWWFTVGLRNSLKVPSDVKLEIDGNLEAVVKITWLTIIVNNLVKIHG